MILKMINMKNVHNDEDYVQHLKAQSILSFGLIILGAILAMSYFFGRRAGLVELSEMYEGFYSGMIGAFVLMGIIFPIKNQRIIKQPALVKKMRIRDSDERNLELSNKAVRFTCFMQFLAAYAMILFGPFYSQLLFYSGLFLFAVFGVSYLTSYVILKYRY